MEERTVEISANEYRKLIELEGRVNAALVFWIQMNMPSVMCWSVF